MPFSRAALPATTHLPVYSGCDAPEFQPGVSSCIQTSTFVQSRFTLAKFYDRFGLKPAQIGRGSTVISQKLDGLPRAADRWTAPG